jgi:RNA polymerase sigma factor (sigma-70 family)
MSIEQIYRSQSLKPLDREEEVQIWSQFMNGDSQARDRLIRSYFPYIISQAIKRANSGIPVEDLIQEGMMGFVHGMGKFDPLTGNRLMTYCSFWVDCYIRRYIGNHRTTVRIPIEAQKDSKGYAADFSLNNTTDKESDTTYLEALPDEFTDTADVMSDREDADLVQRAVKRVRFRAKIKEVAMDVVKMRILADEPCRLQDVADLHGLSRERIRQIEVEARAAIKRSILHLAA